MRVQSVLVLDDCEDVLELARILIEKLCDRTVLTATSLDEIITHNASALACELAILDINLGPGKPNGIDAYRWLRGRGYEAPIIFLTAHARTYPLVLEAERLGDARVFSKPIPTDTLVRLVRGGGYET